MCLDISINIVLSRPTKGLQLFESSMNSVRNLNKSGCIGECCEFYGLQDFYKFYEFSIVFLPDKALYTSKK